MIAFLGAVGDVLGSSTMYESMMRFAIVLAFAAVGEWVAERAGTLNISVEAMLIGGAFTGAVVYGDTNNTVLGLLSGIAAGGIVGWVQANLSKIVWALILIPGLMAVAGAWRARQESLS